MSASVVWLAKQHVRLDVSRVVDRPAPVVHANTLLLAKLMAAIIAPLPHAMRPVTLEEVLSLEQPNIVSTTAIREQRTLFGLGIEHPNTMSTIVPAYLQRFHRRGQFANYGRSERSP